MRQPRLEQYFKTPAAPAPDPGLSFLDFPHNVRKLIYEHVGITDRTIDLNFANLFVYRRNEYPSSVFSYKNPCWHVHAPVRRLRDEEIQFGQEEVWEEDIDENDMDIGYTPCCDDNYALLLVSKFIHAELLPLVYSSNDFTVRQGNPNGLTRLRNMGKTAMAALTSLTIRLDSPQDYACFCKDDLQDEDLPSPIDIIHAGGLRCADIAKDRLIMEGFKEVISRLAASIKPDTLSLYLVFRTKNVETLRAVLETMSQLPLLKECGIWTFVGEIPRDVRSKLSLRSIISDV